MLSLSAALLMITAQALDPQKAAALGQSSNQASQALLKCEQGQKAKLAADTPEAAAAGVFRACAAEREALFKAKEALNTAIYPPDVAAAMRAETESNANEKRIATTIRLQRAEQANAKCIGAEIEELAATVTPEAGAATVFNACAALREAALKARLVWLEISPLRDEWQTALIAQFKAAPKDPEEIADAKTEIADAIRKQRGQASAPAPAQ